MIWSFAPKSEKMRGGFLAYYFLIITLTSHDDIRPFPIVTVCGCFFYIKFGETGRDFKFSGCVCRYVPEKFFIGGIFAKNVYIVRRCIIYAVKSVIATLARLRWLNRFFFFYRFFIARRKWQRERTY
jgi:hypothetical protein